MIRGALFGATAALHKKHCARDSDNVNRRSSATQAKEARREWTGEGGRRGLADCFQCLDNCGTLFSMPQPHN
jgi:hypothetical protein